MQNLGGQTKNIMVFSEVAYSSLLHGGHIVPGDQKSFVLLR